MRKPDNSNCNANFVSCGLKLLWPWCSGHSVRVATQGTTQPNSSIWDDLRSLALVLLLLLLLADGFHKPIHSTVPPNSPWLLSRTLITPLFPFILVVRSSSPLPPQITELDHPFALLGVLPSRLRFYSTSWLFQSLLGQFPRGWLAFSIPPPPLSLPSLLFLLLLLLLLHLHRHLLYPFLHCYTIVVLNYSSMDTDWCLRCGRHTVSCAQSTALLTYKQLDLFFSFLKFSQIEGNDVYCSKQCMVLDQSLAHSLPARTSYHRRASFDLPPIRTSPRTELTTSHLQKPLHHRRARPSDPTHNVTRFRDEELQDLHAGVYHHIVPSQYSSGKDYKSILRWAASVQPGLEEEEEYTPSPASSIPVDIDKLARPPFFPLTAQNLAPPCVTIDPRHIVFHDFPCSKPQRQQQQQRHDRRTAPSLIQSQDDASFLTPASESVNTPSVVPDASSTASSHVARPLLGRFVNKISSWISTPAQIPRPMIDATPHATEPSPGEDLVHSDETLRVHVPYQEKTSVVPIPKNYTRQKPHRLVSSPPYDYDIA